MSNFKQELIEAVRNGRATHSYFSICSDPESLNAPPPLQKILGLTNKHLSPAAMEVLKLQEEGFTDTDSAKFSDFKWKILAFITIQDIFDIPVFKVPPDGSLGNDFRQWYFYYEGKYTLLELLLCGLNGFYVSSQALLRSFIEFNLLQNYFYLKRNDTRSLAELEAYLKQKYAPKQSTLVSNCLPHAKITCPIKKRFELALNRLSGAASHAYHPEHSQHYRAGSCPEPTLEGIHFWVSVSLMLEPVLWMYFVNFPMLFQPVDILRKFGFSMPVGLFIDKQSHHCIKKSLPEQDYKEFQSHAFCSEDVKNLLSWYNNMPDLSDDAIKATWSKDDGDVPHDTLLAYAKVMSKMRATKEAMASLWQEPADPCDFDENKAIRSMQFTGWKELYKKLSSR